MCHDKQWDVALAHDDNGNITAALPYLRGKKLGIRYIVQPQLTQYNGPWYRQGADHNYADMIADYVSTHRETLEKRAKELRERNKASRRPKPKKQEPEKKDA